MNETPVWRAADRGDGYEVVRYSAKGTADPSEEALERQERLRCVGDTARAAMEELSNVYGRAIDDIKLARSLVPMDDEGHPCRPCCCDGWEGVLAGLSWSYAAHTSGLVRRAAAMLALLASADEEVIGDTT